MPANDVNLLTARIIKAAIMLEVNQRYRPRRLGAIQALLSPSANATRMNFSPYSTNRDTNRIAWSIPSGRDIPCPTVTHNYRPAYALSADSERIRAATEAPLTSGTDQTVVYNYFKQKAYACNPSKELFEDRTLAYYDQILSGNLSIPSMPGSTQRALSAIGMEIVQSFDATFMVPTNSWALTFLYTRVGTNAAYPAVVLPTAAAPVVEVDGFDAVGAPKVDLLQFFEETKVANNFQGRPIVIGGMTMLRYLSLKGIMAVNSGGFDFAAIFNALDIEFYYDETIETTQGSGSFIMFDSGAAFAETFCYHDFPQFVDPNSTGDTIDEKMGISLVRFQDDNAALANGSASFIRALDLRVKKARDANDFSKTTLTPSLAAGIWGRPAGYFTSENGNPLKTMTGVFAGKII